MYNQAETLRLECKCPVLTTRDPRIAVAHLQQLIAEKKAAKSKDAASSRTSSDANITVPHDPASLPQPKS